MSRSAYKQRLLTVVMLLALLPQVCLAQGKGKGSSKSSKAPGAGIIAGPDFVEVGVPGTLPPPGAMGPAVPPPLVPPIVPAVTAPTVPVAPTIAAVTAPVCPTTIPAVPAPVMPPPTVPAVTAPICPSTVTAVPVTPPPTIPAVTAPICPSTIPAVTEPVVPAPVVPAPVVPAVTEPSVPAVPVPVYVPPPTDAPIYVPPPTDASVVVPAPSDAPVYVPPPSDAPVYIPPPTDAPVYIPPPTDAPVYVPPPTDAPVAGGQQVDDGGVLSTFQAQLVLTVSDNIMEASQSDIDTLGQNFVDSYNLGQTDPSVCDPFKRQLTGLVQIQAGFTYSRRRDLLDISEDSSSSGATSNVRDLKSNFSSFVMDLNYNPPMINGLSHLMLVVSGTCSNCAADTRLFDDVSGRRLLEVTLSRWMTGSSASSPRSLQTTCDPTTATLTSPSEAMVLSLLAAANAADGISQYEVTDIAELALQTCPAPLNLFGGPDTIYTFTLKIPPLSFQSMTFHDTMYHMTEANNFGEYYNTFTKKSFCDPWFRRMTVSRFVGAEVGEKQTVMTFKITGVCTGCDDLWNPPARRRQRSLRHTPRGRKSNDMLRQLSTKQEQQHEEERQLQEMCYCNKDVTDANRRTPTKAEFEEYMTAKFYEVANILHAAEGNA